MKMKKSIAESGIDNRFSGGNKKSSFGTFEMRLTVGLLFGIHMSTDKHLERMYIDKHLEYACLEFGNTVWAAAMMGAPENHQEREEHGEWALAQHLDKTPAGGPRRGPQLMVFSPALIRAVVFTTSIKNRESLPKHLKSLGVY